MIFNMVGGGVDAGLPKFTYTGNYQLVDDGKSNGRQNWRLKLLTSGTLTFTRSPGTLDVFLVGGGSGGHGGGGGGGTTGTLESVVASKDTGYSIVIGAGGSASVAGGKTSAFGLTKNGGYIDSSFGAKGGTGGNYGGGAAWYGTAGNGGSNGTGTGAQGYTTREFGETTGAQYAGGGGGGTESGTPGKGGDGGGANGGYTSPTAPSAAANTGGGGGGSGFARNPGKGGSGIVIIRNHR